MNEWVTIGLLNVDYTYHPVHVWDHYSVNCTDEIRSDKPSLEFTVIKLFYTYDSSIGIGYMAAVYTMLAFLH